ncbi:aurora other [Micractinium conductrix]|uniref:Aurora other n=1 Tax=Micractinium conductrix TaxID=554055 RepID=A0A2P6V9E8_9CHLO|nr:aurora other [Micractinium conductrix]|eukprot:PSC70705.1 aurora other [Micractinium conductrix]
MGRPGGQWSLSDFTLTKQLYKGKASTLYQATDKPSGATVALKSYSKRRLSTLNWYQVEREVRLHSQLRHPNVISLHAAFEDDNYVFMITQFAAGGDLYEDLKRAGGQMRERVVAGEVLPPFMDALSHMHARSIIHRDIKPENILLTADRVIKVADFGLSINWGEERPVTRAGTLDYMSPEVLACPEKSRPEENKERLELGYTDAVDVWAVGVLAYELLVGKPPFERESREETYAYIQRKDPALPAWLSEGAKDFIMTALAKSARKRPSMAQLLDHPWIVQYCRRPSSRPTTSSSATSATPADLHLPLHELHGPRASLHGAKSCRDFNALLSPAVSIGPGSLASMLQPALSMAGPALADDATPAARPSTASRLRASTAAARPATPTIPPLPVVEEETAPAAADASQQEGAGLAAALPVPAFATLAAAAAADLPFPKSAGPAGQHISSPEQTDLDHSSSDAHPSHSAAATKMLGASFNLQQATSLSTGDPQSAFLELYKSMAPPPVERPAAPAGHTPRGTSRKASSSISRAGRSSVSKGLEASLPPLQHSQQHSDGVAAAGSPASLKRLPSLRKAHSQKLAEEQLPPLDGAVAGSAAQPVAAASPAPAAPEAAVASAVATVEPLKAVPAASEAVPVGPQRQGNDEGEVPEVQPHRTALPDGGHLVVPAHGKQPVQQQPAEAQDRIKAMRAFLAAEQLEHEGGSASPMAQAQAAAHDRMHEAEQRHLDKLRARASVSPAAAAAGTSAARAGSASRAARPKQDPSASLMQSASNLLTKLLGKKPAATSAAAAAAPTSGIAARKTSVAPAPLERSAGSGSFDAAVSAAAGSPVKPARKSSVAPAPAPARTSIRLAGGTVEQTSPRKAVPAPTARTAPPAARKASAAAVPPTSAATAAAAPEARTYSSSTGEEAVESRSNSLSKTVRFASLKPAGPSMDMQDLIPAFRSASGTASFTTAQSSLPASSLPSLTSGTSSPLRASRKGSASASPPLSRKGSHVAPSGSTLRTSLVHAPGGSGALASTIKPRGSKMASMPGERSAPGAAAASEAHDEEHDGGDAAGGVQRSAVSWSHPASGPPKAAHPSPARKSSASPAMAARLAMYSAFSQLDKKRPGSSVRGSAHHSSGAGSTRNSLHHQPGDSSRLVL